MGRLFWIFLIGLVALSTHIAYILFAPSLLYARHLNQQTAATTQNQFQILELENQKRLFPLLPPASIIGICKFDLTTGPVNLNVALPLGYWTLTIYDRSGKEFYSLNDQQAGTANFNVKLVLAKSAVELLTGGDSEQEARNLGWTVESDAKTGIAVIWVPVGEPLMRAAAMSAMQSTACNVEKTN